jgi:hypothetical protein
MMPESKPLIFVSYAQVDDAPLAGRKGWVTTLVTQLKSVLAMQMGRKEFFDFWMDHSLAGNEPLTPKIEETVRGADVLLIVFSKGYVMSEWCQKEMGLFHAELRKRRSSGARVFVVDFGKVDRPKVLADLLGYRFWDEDESGKPLPPLGFPKPSPKDMRYYNKLHDLAVDLRTELERLKKATLSAPKASAGSHSLPAKGSGLTHDGKPTVFLAQVTDDLSVQRDEVKRYLTQAGLCVIPDALVYPYDSVASYQERVKADMEPARLFVQLLSAIPGVGRFPSDSRSFVAVQHEAAIQLGIPVFQRRDAELAIDTVTDAKHRALLEGPTVSATGRVEFMRLVVERVCELCDPGPKLPELEPEPPKWVFILAEGTPVGLAVADRLRDELVQFRKLPCFLLGDQSAPSKVRERREAFSRRCHALIFVLDSNPDWLAQELEEFVKILFLHKKPAIPIAVCEGPPKALPCGLSPRPCFWGDPGASGQGVGGAAGSLFMPDVRVIDCRAGSCASAFDEFLKSI